MSRLSAERVPLTLSGDSFTKAYGGRDDCMFCHEEGVGDAPRIQHSGISDILLSAKCHTCRVPAAVVPVARRLHADARPTLPMNDDHSGAWRRDDCPSCHETVLNGAPKLLHRKMPRIIKGARCRTCHVPTDG